MLINSKLKNNKKLILNLKISNNFFSKEESKMNCVYI